MSDPVLELSGIEKCFNRGASREVTVLHGAELSLDAGKVVALVAPSGAGKSTLLQIAGLLDTPDAGRVVIGGKDMSCADDSTRTMARRCDVGFVYQFHHLLPEFSAEENVVLPQLANGTAMSEAIARARGLLGRVGLTERGGHRPAELSGGEQQRVAICRALANAPQLLLADEPTGNLDPSTSGKIFEVLSILARENGMAALVATHNHELASRTDRIVRITDGLVVSD